jgi:apolipoprotein N-acyltransferase
MSQPKLSNQFSKEDEVKSNRNKQPLYNDRRALLWLGIYALAALFSGRLTFFLAAWVGPVFGLRFLRSQKTGRGTLLLFIGTYIPLLISWNGMTAFDMPIYPVFMLLTSLLAVLPYLFDRWLTPRFAKNGLTPFVASLIFPLALTGIEYLTMTGGPLGSFGAQAYTQYDFLVFAQLASLTGMWGITFLVTWFGSLVNWAWERGFQWQQIKLGVLPYAVIMLLVIGYGSVRLLTPPEPTTNVKVASFTAEAFHPGELFPMVSSDLEGFREKTTSIHDKYIDQTVAYAQQGAQIVVWPEMSGSGYYEDVETLIERGQTIAHEEGIYLAITAMSLFADENRTDENKLYIIDPNGEVAIEHVKYGGNMIEGTLLGDGVLQSIETPYGNLSGVICWDTDYQNKIRQVGQMDVDILLSPSYVWPEMGTMHAKMAAFRAIENGVTIVRQEDGGVSAFIDPYGRFLTTAEHAAGETMIFSDLPVLGSSTLYPSIGDIVGQLSIVGFLVMAVWAIIAGRKPREDLEN